MSSPFALASQVGTRVAVRSEEHNFSFPLFYLSPLSLLENSGFSHQEARAGRSGREAEATRLVEEAAGWEAEVGRGALCECVSLCVFAGP